MNCVITKMMYLVKVRAAINFVVFLGFAVLLGQIDGLAYPHGSRGGIRNESNVSIEIRMEYKGGDYEFKSLPPNASLDFPDDLIRITVRPHLLDPPDQETNIKVTVWKPDGSRHELDDFDQTLHIGTADDQSRFTL